MALNLVITILAIGGSEGKYDGRYQMGAMAKTDGARMFGIQDPGHVFQ